MVTNGQLYLLNTWLKENGVAGVRVGASKNKNFGYVFGLYEINQNDKRKKFIYRTPDFDMMARKIANVYGIVPPAVWNIQ